MNNRALEARFEEQIEELKDRLHECLHAPAGTGEDARLARDILEGLIADYQQQLAAMRRTRAAARDVT
ncbi:MAG: hypothetical protein AB7U81_02775 [Thiohalomonadaceae bacterium]